MMKQNHSMYRNMPALHQAHEVALPTEEVIALVHWSPHCQPRRDSDTNPWTRKRGGDVDPWSRKSSCGADPWTRTRNSDVNPARIHVKKAPNSQPWRRARRD
jgi:hypothetical protein